ncbi:MAG: SRPBCC family protein [Gemmatimonadales bacterium]
MPSPISITHTATVGAPIDKVFALITNPTRMPDWLPGCRAVTPKETPLRKGDLVHIAIGDAPYRIEIEIIDLNPPFTFGWVELRRRSGSKTFFKLQPAMAGATEVTIRYISNASTIRAWINGQWYRRRDARRTFDGTINNLRKLLQR